MSFRFIRDHAGWWPVRLIAGFSRTRPAANTRGVAVQKVRGQQPTASCSVRCAVCMPIITALMAVLGCMPRFVRKAGRQAGAGSSA